MKTYTVQERKNHKWYLYNLILFSASLILFEISIIEKYVIPFCIALVGLFYAFISIFFNGYAHGWELKRISMLKDELEEEENEN